MHYTLHNLGTMVGPIRGAEHSWFTSYLTDQSVPLENITSNGMDISYGVPQGFILGPLLFTLMIFPLSPILVN